LSLMKLARLCQEQKITFLKVIDTVKLKRSLLNNSVLNVTDW
jgi:hypothetical protein